jgi:peptidoglycan/xylan/chitin deacetylase (PgdA/CDA1 family)
LRWWLRVAQGRRTRLALAMSSVLAAGIAGVWLLAGAMLSGHPRNTEAAQPKLVTGHSPKTVVSLTFDDAYEDQWRYAVPLLRSHRMTATFYVITADSDGPYPCCMSWAQLRALQGEGDDIGSHTVDHPNLTTVTIARVMREVCRSSQDMMMHGIADPKSFAYPYGSFNSTDERIVARCGFTIARQGGGISSSSTRPEPPWAETLPPKDHEAVRTIAVDGASPIRVSDLENFVTKAVAHGGGWLPITFHDVCDAAASDYSHCMSTYGAIRDTALGQFLDWLRRAGQSGGAPAGVVVQTMRWAMNTVNGADTTPPSTMALCNGSPCQAAAYGGSVRLSLSAADPGGVGVAKTYYTTDSSTPSTSSGIYQIPLIVNQTEIIKFFSVDNAGNTEKVRTIMIKVSSGTGQ